MADKSKYKTKLNQTYTLKEALVYFKTKGLTIAKGISPQKLVELETKLNFNFPPDFKEFHLISNGFLNWEMDENCFSIWTFDRIEESYSETKYTEPDFIPIADYLINCQHYGYIRGKKGIYSDSSLKPVAENFVELINLIIKDSDLLY